MISRQSEFKLVKRGFRDNLLLIPGWAADWRIFDSLDLDYNYLLPVGFNPFDFENCLKDFLASESISKFSIFGLSLGAFLAADFAAKNQEKIDELILLGARRRYNLKALQEIEFKLQRNRRAYLYKFYRDCFSPADKEGLAWFKKHVLKSYLDGIKLETLIQGLDYLSCVYLRPESLSEIKRIRIFHGEQDKIAPIKEVRVIKTYLPQAELISIKDSGHLFFLNPDFRAIFNG